jgi:5-methyltetrahydrofolate--homocysteine methyltransferase
MIYLIIMRDLVHILSEHVLIFDGAMGTMIQEVNPDVDAFHGHSGCNEILNISSPELIKKIHASFLEAGADAVETNTFGANRITLSEYGLSEKAYELNRASARIAKEIAASFSGKPRFVSGSIGPTSKLPSLGHIDPAELHLAYSEQVSGLVDGGCDFLQIETCQDILQAKTACIAAAEVMNEKQKFLPVFCQFTVDRGDKTLLGTEIEAIIAVFSGMPHVQVLGLNCGSGPEGMRGALEKLFNNSPLIISCLPNAGLPENIDGKLVYGLDPETFAIKMKEMIVSYGVQIAGGCCGTTPEHIKALVNAVQGIKPAKRLENIQLNSCASHFISVSLKQDPPPLIAGERTNINGSREFREKILSGDFEGAAAVAKNQEKEGAHLIDLSVAYAGRNEISDMLEMVKRLRTSLESPLMIDSTSSDVIKAAAENYGGRFLINSVNLEDGGVKLREILDLARKYSLAVVALTIDEQGMALKSDNKLSIAERILKIAEDEFSLTVNDIFFDPLTFTLGSGDENLKDSAKETIEAIGLITNQIKGSKTILGISNVSFGLKPGIRKYLNSVFLHHALKAGLTAAILNAGRILPMTKIPPDIKEAAQRLIFNDNFTHDNPLKYFIETCGKYSAADKTEIAPVIHASPEELLKSAIINGDKSNLENLIKTCLEKMPAPELLNSVLIEAMKTTGNLFESGDMQLPFVLESAETMKCAVKILNPHLDKSGKSDRGTIVLATVRGDVHDIGKNLVDIILSNNGFRVINLGIRQPVEKIAAEAEKNNAMAIGLSGLLVKSTLIMKEDLEQMERMGLKYPVILGGAALTGAFVEDVLEKSYSGEVFYAQDAFEGLHIINNLAEHKIRAKQKSGIKKTVKRLVNLSRKKTQNIKFLHNIPDPPFYGIKIIDEIRLKDLIPFLDKNTLFKAHWAYRRGKKNSAQYEEFVKNTLDPLLDELIAKYDKILKPHAVYGYFRCCSFKENLLIYDENGIEVCCFKFSRLKNGFCISDFFLAKDSGKSDIVPVFAVTMGENAAIEEKRIFAEGNYREYLHVHGLSIAIAEACAEYLHSHIRNEVADVAKTMDPASGRRFSPGYQSWQNLEDQRKILDLLDAKRIGLSLTETYQLVPEQSVTALISFHPEVKKAFD